MLSKIKQQGSKLHVDVHRIFIIGSQRNLGALKSLNASGPKQIPNSTVC
jgi:hypothetical protein